MDTSAYDKKHICVTCGKLFKLKSALVVHNRIHSGEKPYSCDVCAKSFTQKGSLTRHQLTHSGLKIYECNVCKKCFSLSAKNRKKIKSFRLSVYLTSAVNLCLTVLSSVIPNACCSTVEQSSLSIPFSISKFLIQSYFLSLMIIVVFQKCYLWFGKTHIRYQSYWPVKASAFRCWSCVIVVKSSVVGSISYYLLMHSWSISIKLCTQV